MTAGGSASQEVNVFVSYAHSDGLEIAEAIAGCINGHGSGQMYAWIDHELRRGELFDDAIQEAISNADVGICVVTAGFSSSEYIQEVELPALMKRHRSRRNSALLIPLMAGGYLFGGLEDLHAGNMNEIFDSASADADARVYRELADEIFRSVEGMSRGVRRRQLSPTQKRRLVRDFVDSCAAWQGEEENYQDFWRGLVGLVGYTRPAMLQFQRKVRTKTGRVRKLDCYVPGRFVGESKSRSEKSLDAGEAQAVAYVQLLEEVPQVVITSNYSFIRISTLTGDAEVADTVEFPISEIGANLAILEALFSDDYAVGVRRELTMLAPEMANRMHIRLIKNFRDTLVHQGMSQKQAFTLTMRVLFLLVADDLGLLNANPSDRIPGRFDQFLRRFTSGASLTAELQVLFSRLNEREDWAREDGFPYVNGGLFADQMAFPVLTDQALQALGDASAADWSHLDPFLFGSLYQETHSRDERAEFGQHFTSAANIRKALDPLFLDEFRQRLENARGYRDRLLALQQDMARLRVLDPAAGCGNFLLTAYQDLKGLEREVIGELLATGMQAYSTLVGLTDGDYAGKTTIALRPIGGSGRGRQSADVHLPLVQMTHFAGIEIDDSAAALARTVLVLAAVQAEFELGETTDLSLSPLPLNDDNNALVHVADALDFDWATAWVGYECGLSECTVIVGNPPFLGHKQRSAEQSQTQRELWAGVANSGGLDFVANWFLVAARAMQNTAARAAFVATSSITQGEQPAILWPELRKSGMTIDFAHRSFPWRNDGGQQAAVHCVIIGFSDAEYKPKSLRLWLESGESLNASNINGYLTDGEDVFVKNRSTPLAVETPRMGAGSTAMDFGGSLSNISDEEAQEICVTDSIAAGYLRRIMGGEEFLNNSPRWCLWLENLTASDHRGSPVIRERVSQVRLARLRSGREATKKLAETPHLFGEIRQPTGAYLALPQTSSERREYIPCDFLPAEVIATIKLYVVPAASYALFGLLSSKIFTAWNRAVSGRLESRFSISVEVTYNNFPIPQIDSDLEAAVSSAAERVLAARRAHPNSSLAEIYDPDTFYLYEDVKAAHRQLDRAVLDWYQIPVGADDSEMTRRLFALYKQSTDAQA